jgi:CrcB protein
LEKYLYIAIGGSLGSIARYWVGSTVSGRLGTRFLYGTFVINITACVIIGFALTYLGRRADLNPACAWEGRRVSGFATRIKSITEGKC